MRSFSIVKRLTLLYSFGSGFIFIFLAVVLTNAVDNHFYIEAKGVAVNKASSAYNILSEEGVESLNDVSIYKRLLETFENHESLSLWVFDENKNIYFKINEFSIAGYTGADLLEKNTLGFFGEESKFVGFVRNVKVNKETYKIVSVVDLGKYEEFIDSLKNKIFFYVAISMILSGLLGWFSARNGLKSVGLIRNHVYSVTAERLKDKMPDFVVPSEIEELQSAVNDMLERLDESFRKLSDFGADLTHELRTPINNLMIQTEVILRKERDPEEYQTLLFSNMEEYQRLAKTIDDMLFLAKTDRGLVLPNIQFINAKKITEDLIEFYYVLSSEEEIDLKSIGEVSFYGDPLMIRRAVSNLISNAIRHTKSQGSVIVSLEEVDDDILIEVMNTGDPIPDDISLDLFRRFYRVSSDQLSKGHEGYGLGLAIVKAIAAAHGGETSITRKGGYNVFQISIPRS